MKTKEIMRTSWFLVVVLALFLMGVAFGKHQVSLKDVTRDLDSAESNIESAERQIPPGTLAGNSLSMAKQSIRRAKKRLVEYAEQQGQKSDPSAAAGRCTVDGGKTWFPTRADGMCYTADAGQVASKN